MASASLSRLIESGRFGDAIRLLGEPPAPLVSAAVERAFLDGLVGNLERAAAAASRLLTHHLTSRQRALCVETIARASDRTIALALVEKARQLLADSGDVVEFARFSVRSGRTLLNLVGIEAVLSELPRIRRAVVRAGDVQATVDLHLLMAETEAKRGKRTRSSAHLRLAASLLQGKPNLFQEARLEQIRSNVAWFCSRLREAVASASRCAELAELAGWDAGIGGVLGNIAQFRLALGDIDEAEQFLNRASAHGQTSRIVDFAAKDTLLQLLMARGSAEAVALADNLWANTFVGEWRHSYYGLWHIVTRAALLAYSAQLDEASAVIREALPAVRQNSDGNLLARMCLQGAHIEVARGLPVSAAYLVLEVFEACDELPLGSVADIQSVMGKVLVVSDREAGLSYFDRANRLLRGGGLQLAAAELGRTCDVKEGYSKDWVSVESARATYIVHGLSALTYIAGVPEVLGDEVSELLRELSLVQSTRLVKPGSCRLIGASVDSNEPSDCGGPEVRIRLSADGDDGIELWVTPKGSGHSILGVIAVRQLIHSFVDLESARTAKRETLPIWRDDTPEQQLGMIVVSESMTELVDTARRLAPSSITVLILGETGTGKELLARALHDASPRKHKPFIPFNCSAVARDMLDAQLFGYRRGAFTGATDAFQGVIRAATGGTLFLDEIGEITTDVQPKLLRFLESGEIHPLGEATPSTVDVRIVAATNANLEELVSAGRFREDLFYRLNVVRLDVPPLRERREEIPPLVQYHLDKFSREAQKTGLRPADETMEYLMLYRWPGNVRQLVNEIRRLVALAESGAVLMPEHLSPDIAASRKTIPASERDLTPHEFVVRRDQPMIAAVEHVERTMIQYALKQSAGVEEAAQMLGLSRKGLYLKRQRLGLMH
ncbi:MAG: sigma-54 interaction domain-containing protein [Acidobacteriota bacterium]